MGIPAYNEEANIGYLLQDVLKQKTEGFVLEKIIVVSDGSTDNTASFVRVVSDNRIILVDDGERKGQASRQNEIIALTDSEILVLLNADIALRDEEYILRLVTPVLQERADFSASNTRAVEPKNFLEKILDVSEQWKRHMIEHWRKGNNLYTCKGAARAFSKTFYSKIVFPKRIGEDAYSYFFGIKNGFRYQYVSEAVAWMKLPDIFGDHVKQSHRFRQSQIVSSHEFGEKFIREQYHIPNLQVLKSSLLFLWRHPVLFTGYLCIYFVTVYQSYFSRPISDLWNISTTSKKLR